MPAYFCASVFYAHLAHEHRDSVTFVTLPLDHADELFPGTLERANEARQELLWTLADADEVLLVCFTGGRSMLPYFVRLVPPPPLYYSRRPNFVTLNQGLIGNVVDWIGCR